MTFTPSETIYIALSTILLTFSFVLWIAVTMAIRTSEAELMPAYGMRVVQKLSLSGISIASFAVSLVWLNAQA